MKTKYFYVLNGPESEDTSTEVMRTLYDSKDDCIEIAKEEMGQNLGYNAVIYKAQVSEVDELTMTIQSKKK